MLTVLLFATLLFSIQMEDTSSIGVDGRARPNSLTNEPYDPFADEIPPALTNDPFDPFSVSPIAFNDSEALARIRRNNEHAVHRSNQLKRTSNQPFAVLPIPVTSSKWLRVRYKRSADKNLVNGLNGTDEEWNRALSFFWNLPISERGVMKAVRHVWGTDENGAHRTNKTLRSYKQRLNRWIEKNVRETVDARKPGASPHLGRVMDAMTAGFCNQKAERGQSVNDEELCILMANSHNALHDIHPQCVDLVDPDSHEPKHKVDTRCTKRMRSCYDGASHRTPQELPGRKMRSGGHIREHQMNFAGELEEIGFKEPGGDIYPQFYDRIHVCDEVGGKTKPRADKINMFNAKDKQGNKLEGHRLKGVDPRHVTLLPFATLDGVGSMLPPLVVVPNKKHIGTYILKAGHAAWKDATFGVNPSGSGFIHSAIFYDAFMRFKKESVFPPAELNGVFYEKPCKECPVIFILDGHTSRYVDPNQIEKLYEAGIWLWITPPNGTWKVSVLDQMPFKEYQRLKGIQRQRRLALGQLSWSLDLEVSSCLTAMYQTLISDGFYVQAAAKRCGLIPFRHDFKELRMHEVYGVDVHEDVEETTTSRQQKHMPKRTLADVHLCGGWLHDKEVLTMVRATWEKAQQLKKKKLAKKKKAAAKKLCKCNCKRKRADIEQDVTSSSLQSKRPSKKRCISKS